MEHCKKLILVPHDTLSRLHEKPIGRTQDDVMGDLDLEMKNILLKKAQDSEKWKMYNQTLQRFLHYANEQRKPVTIALPSLPNEEQTSRSEEDNDNMLARLTSLVPQKFKHNASSLYDFLVSKQSRSFIEWDSFGHVKIADSQIPQSNIIEMISDAVRNRKSAQASGWEAFATVLKKINVPLDLIGNSQYRDIIRSQRGTGSASFPLSRIDTAPQDEPSTRPPTPARAQRTLNTERPAGRTSDSSRRRRRVASGKPSTRWSTYWALR